MHYGLRSTKKTRFVAAAAQVVAGLALLSSLNVQAQAKVRCVDSAATTRGNGAVYSGTCSGSNKGLLNDSWDLQDLENKFPGMEFRSGGKSNDAANSPFSADPAGLTSGTLTFKTPVMGFFVIGLQGVPDPDPLGGGSSFYSYYVFNGGPTGVSSLLFDTDGVEKTDVSDGIRGPELAFASLYFPVPEPATNALLVAGLGALAWVAHRRTVKAMPADATAKA